MHGNHELHQPISKHFHDADTHNTQLLAALRGSVAKYHVHVPRRR
jgi:hypothetical protein